VGRLFRRGPSLLSLASGSTNAEHVSGSAASKYKYLVLCQSPSTRTLRFDRALAGCGHFFEPRKLGSVPEAFPPVRMSQVGTIGKYHVALATTSL
jgi:hypothetical protein